MKRGLFFLSLLAALTFCLRAASAQETRQAPDTILRASTQAMRDGRMADAEKIIADAVHDLEQTEPQNPRLATYLRRLSTFAYRRDDHAGADAFMQRALEIDQKAFGPQDMQITLDLMQESSFAQSSGDPGKAEQYLNDALKVVRANSAGLNSQPNIGLGAGVFGDLATLYIHQHRWIEAEPMLQQEAKLCGMIQEPYRAGFAKCSQIERQFAEVSNAEGKTPDPAQLPHVGDFPEQLESLNKAGEKFKTDGLYPSAEETYNRAIALAEKMEADPQNRYGGLVISEMNSLGQVYEKEGSMDRAERTYLSALEIDENKAGPETGHTVYATLLAPFYLVNLYRSEGRLKDAEPLLQHVLEIQVNALGERNRAVVQTLTMLARVYEEEGRTDEAKYALAQPLYERAIAIQEVNLGPNDKDLVPLLGEYAVLLQELHQDARAAEVRTRIAKIWPPAQGSSQ